MRNIAGLRLVKIADRTDPDKLSHDKQLLLRTEEAEYVFIKSDKWGRFIVYCSNKTETALCRAEFIGSLLATSEGEYDVLLGQVVVGMRPVLREIRSGKLLIFGTTLNFAVVSLTKNSLRYRKVADRFC